MQLQLVFKKTGDFIPVDITHNQDVLEFFVEEVNSNSTNEFLDGKKVCGHVSSTISNLLRSIERSNIMMQILSDSKLTVPSELECLDQQILNKIHRDWVKTQEIVLDIDQLRIDPVTSRIGNILHEMYPDDIRIIRIAEALRKLGYIEMYEDINLGIHSIEGSFMDNEMVFDTVDKYKVFKNPFWDTMVTNNGGTNFNFAYTYLGRQTINKYEVYDDNLDNDDYYDYDRLEFAFNLNFRKPQNLPFSQEYIKWCEDKKISPRGYQIPIGNICDLNQKNSYYRQILYKNVINDNPIMLILK